MKQRANIEVCSKLRKGAIETADLMKKVYGINFYLMHKYPDGIRDSKQAWKQFLMNLGRDVLFLFVMMCTLPKSENAYTMIVI